MLKVFASLFVIATLLTGCGKSDPLKRQAVNGEITLEGTSLAAGTITFDPKTGGTMSGATVTNGKFHIPQESGLPAGDYVVRLSSAGDELAPAEEAPGESNRLAVELIPPEYGSESTQTVTISEGKENIVKIDVPSRRKSKK